MSADLFALACLATLLYVYVGYPLILGGLSLVRPRPVRRGRTTLRVTVLIPAHNEVGMIRRKILNTVESDYPADHMEILVLSDGSTDGTVEVARATVEELGSPAGGAPSVRVLDLPRRGKAHTLNAGAQEATGEVLVLTDANVELRSDAIRLCVENFFDPDVGGVSAEKRHRSSAAGPTAKGESLYWRYESGLKRLESITGNVVAADGAFHALRARLYVPVRNPASADDMAISMRVVLQGYRLVYDERAVAVETAPTDAGNEFRRKVRITNHSMRALLSLGPALLTSGLYSFQILSHKLLRHLSPLFMAGLLVGSAVSAWGDGGAAMRLLLLGQAIFYGGAMVGRRSLRSGAAGRSIVAALHHFALMQAAALVGLVSLARGVRLIIWTPRGGMEAP